MLIRVGRNEPCPCGSGKKYKNCCGKKEAISITSIIEEEVAYLQAQIIEYALYAYEDKIEIDFDDKSDEIMVNDEEEMEFFSFVHLIWYCLFVPVDRDATILEKFIEERGRFIQRPKLREILQTWTAVRPIAGRMLSLSKEKMVIKDTLTEEVIEIKLLEPVETFENVFAFGFIVPFGQENIFFSTVFDLEGTEDEKEEAFLKEMFVDSEISNPVAFLQAHFFELMNAIQFVGLEYSPDDFEWANPAHKEVAILFEHEMKKENAPATNRMVGFILWFKYCETKQFHRRRPATYAAALHYLTTTINPFFEITKKEVADKYGVSPSSMTQAVIDIEEEVADVIEELKNDVLGQLLDALEAEGFDLDDDDDLIF